MLTAFAWVILAALTLKLGFEWFLEHLNSRFLQGHRSRVPPELAGAIDAETFDRTIDYDQAGLPLERASAVFSLLSTLLLLAFGIFGYVDRFARAAVAWAWGTESPYLSAVVFLSSLMILSGALSLPFGYWRTFVIDKRFGFTKTSVALWLRDKFVGSIIGLVLTALLFPLILWIMEVAGSLWWLYAAFAVMLFHLFVSFLAPAVILPLFNKFEELNDQELKRKVLEMCERLRFPIMGVYQIDGSRRSTKANAFMAGFGRLKRIALFDTLLSTLSHDQILAVLAHEIGHNKRRHALKMLALGVLQSVLYFWLLSFLIEYRPLYDAFGIETPSRYTGLVAASSVVSLLMFFVGPLFSLRSRAHEFEADRYAVEAVGSSEALASSLVALTKSNLTPPTAHPAYSFFWDSHPRLLPRLEALRACRA